MASARQPPHKPRPIPLHPIPSAPAPTRHLPLLLKALSALAAALALASLASARHRLRRHIAATHRDTTVTVPYTYCTPSLSPSLLFAAADALFWLPLFYTVLVLLLAVFYQPDAAFERLVAVRSAEEEERLRRRWVEGWRGREDERVRREREGRRRGRLLLGVEAMPVEVRWGRGVKDEVKVAWWEARRAEDRERRSLVGVGGAEPGAGKRFG